MIPTVLYPYTENPSAKKISGVIFWPNRLLFDAMGVVKKGRADLWKSIA